MNSPPRTHQFIYPLLLVLASVAALPLLAVGQGIDRGPGYAQTTWATVHGDSSNSDYVPLRVSTKLRRGWRVLEGAAIWTAPSVAADGTLFVSSGRGPGTSHLHAISPNGNILWESAAEVDSDDLDSGAVTSAPVIDEAGDVYLGDANQMWAFHPDGRVKWVTDTAALGAPGPFVTAIIVDRYIGACSVGGQLVFLDRKTGQFAVPVLNLPGGPSPDGPEIPDWIWADGLMDPARKMDVQKILMGHTFEVTNTPAVHPRSGRIFILAGGRNLDEGLFYGIDLEGGALRIAFETPVDAGTGTSPAISADGKRVFAFDGEGDLIALDTKDGRLLYTADVGGVPASPSVGPDGSVYVLAGERLVKLDGATGEKRWVRRYHDFAAEKLPSVSSFWPFVTTGEPVAAIDSVVTITNGVIWTSLVLGWNLSVFDREVMHNRSTFLVAIDPTTGDLLAHYPLPDTSEGGIAVGTNGELYLDLLAVQASLSAGAPYRWLLPWVMHTPAPQGGLVGFVPTR